jgi:hypothetical protein
MTRRFTILSLATVGIVCMALATSTSVSAQGARPIDGVGYFAAPGECTDAEGNGSDFALRMTGDLEGCHYVFVLDWECSPSGTYRERGTEIFVGSYAGQQGTFGTTYLFSAKLGSCPDLTTEIWGRCQHPILRGSGLGVFEGVTGRFDIKDDIEAGDFPYKGHLRW